MACAKWSELARVCKPLVDDDDAMTTLLEPTDRTRVTRGRNRVVFEATAQAA